MERHWASFWHEVPPHPHTPTTTTHTLLPSPLRQVERHWASFWHEAELMSRLNHPNVLRFYGLVVDGPLVVGIMTGAWLLAACGMV